MNRSQAIRQTHRSLSIVITAAVVAHFVAMALGKSPMWLAYGPLAPLFLLPFSGLYVFVLPYTRKGKEPA
jgi:hypothetical protein